MDNCICNTDSINHMSYICKICNKYIKTYPSNGTKKYYNARYRLTNNDTKKCDNYNQICNKKPHNNTHNITSCNKHRDNNIKKIDNIKYLFSEYYDLYKNYNDTHHCKCEDIPDCVNTVINWL